MSTLNQLNQALPALTRAAGLPTDYEPMEGLKAVAVAEAAERHFRRAKDATQLEMAIGVKLTEQWRFVIWWDAQEKAAGALKRGPAPASLYGDAGAVAADFGIDRMTIHRWRKKLVVKDNPTDTSKLEAEIERQVARTVRIVEFDRSATEQHRATGSGENEWYTPPEYIALAREVMGGIDLDPASSAEANETVDAAEFYTVEDDGLEQQWYGRVWLNPPYSRDLMPKFMDKLKAEYKSGNIRAAIVVTHNNTDTGWFHSLADIVSAICFASKRIKFYRGDTVAAPVNGQMFLYFGADVPAFTTAFAPVGLVMVPS